MKQKPTSKNKPKITPNNNKLSASIKIKSAVFKNHKEQQM